ncbi:MAG: hypothetical protein GXC75_04205 [Xanthomonadaceae bacterium]|nr:hypothetical protein [Xanthomonadaceae bacterium]
MFRNAGCQQLQGYLQGSAVPAEEFAAQWLSNLVARADTRESVSAGVKTGLNSELFAQAIEVLIHEREDRAAAPWSKGAAMDAAGAAFAAIILTGYANCRPRRDLLAAFDAAIAELCNLKLG